jgi:predicted transposase YbfD/YdcC
MQSTPLLGALFDDLSAEQRTMLLSPCALESLEGIFATIPDPRSRHGRRYALPFLLTCLVAALLCNCNALDAVGPWCADHRPLLRRLFGPRRFLTPSSSLYRKLLPRLSAASIEWTLARWVSSTRPPNDTEAIALDGKVVRGARSRDQAAPHLLSVSTHASAETLIQVPVSDKTNEIPVAQMLIPYLTLAGRVLTADALHCQIDLAQAVLDAGGHYLLCVKGNQQLLQLDLMAYFTDPGAACQTALTVERQRGRIERRSLRVTTELNDYLVGFPQVAQSMEITRQVQDRDGAHEEIDYFITSCPAHLVAPAELLALIRGHWSVETRHYIRDVVFGEDRSQLRTGTAPRILAAFRNLTITLIRRTGTTQISATRRHFAAHPRQAFALLRQPPRPPSR